MRLFQPLFYKLKQKINFFVQKETIIATRKKICPKTTKFHLIYDQKSSIDAG